MNQSVQLARLWMTLYEVKGQLDNVAVPLASHLSLNDPELMTAMEELSERIAAHFEQFSLVAEARRKKRGQ
jgi:hypothetical protein